MSLIIYQPQTLGQTAIISVKHITGEVTQEQKGDFVIFKVKNEIVALNVFNASQYFKLVPGAHSLTSYHAKILAQHELEINPVPSFKIGEVITRINHPNSDKLFVLEVQTDQKVQIVTNATNALVGKQVIVAQVGSILPSGQPILATKVLGVKSWGMLCGGETLGLAPTTGVKIVTGTNGEEFIL